MEKVRNAADVAIGCVIDAAVVLAGAKRREMELADLRSQIKSEAISRIMGQDDPQKEGKKYSATAAAELVMTDKVYRLHRGDESAAVEKTIRAMGLYEAAKLRARLETAGAEILGLEPLRLALDEAHLVQVK